MMNTTNIDSNTNSCSNIHININIDLAMDINKMKQTLITDYFDKVQIKKIYGYDPKTDCWFCTKCGINMGKNNPRQLCRKTYCENEFD